VLLFVLIPHLQFSSLSKVSSVLKDILRLGFLNNFITYLVFLPSHIYFFTLFYGLFFTFRTCILLPIVKYVSKWLIKSLVAANLYSGRWHESFGVIISVVRTLKIVNCLLFLSF
jgi:hypothetical protein